MKISGMKDPEVSLNQTIGVFHVAVVAVEAVENNNDEKY